MSRGARWLRACVGACVVCVVLVSSQAEAAYVGTVRTATTQVRFRGIDGHLFGVRLDASTSGLGGTQSFAMMTMTVTECIGSRCGRPAVYTRRLRVQEHSESNDLSLSEVSLPYGRLRILARWSAPAGWGSVPPTARQQDGVAVQSQSPAQATVLIGNDVNGALQRFARCVDDRATVAHAVVATTVEMGTAGRWPDAAPPGLSAKARSQRYLTCAM